MACWAWRRGGSRGGGDESSPPVPLSLRERGNAGPAPVVPRPGRPAADGMRPARSDRGGLQEFHRVRSAGRDRGAADRAAHGAPRRAALPPRWHVRVSSSHHVGPDRSLRRVHGNRDRPRWSLGLVALLLTGCAQRDRIVVGSKNFTESDLLGEIVAQQIERRTGLPVERRFHLGGTFVCHQAITSGQIDLYVEYTGTEIGPGGPSAWSPCC